MVFLAEKSKEAARLVSEQTDYNDEEHCVKHTYLLSSDFLSIQQISCFSGLNDQAV